MDPVDADRRRYFLGVRPEERRQTLLLSLSVLSIVAAYTMVKAVRDAVFLARSSLSAYAMLMVLLAFTAGTLASVGTRLGARVPLVRRIVLTHLIIAVSLVAIWLGFAAHLPALPWILFLWSSFFGLFVLANFWLLANELHDARSAKRLFAILGAGAITGGVVGGELAQQLAPRLGAVNLLPLIAGILLLSAMLAAAAAIARPRLLATPSADLPLPRLSEGLRLIRRHPYLRVIALLLLCATLATTIIDLQVKTIAQRHFAGDPDGMASFFGRLAALFSAVSLSVQLMVTPRFLRRFGVARALLALPTSLTVGTAALGLQGSIAISPLAAATVAKVGDGGLRFSLNSAAMEQLYLPIPAAVKARAKPLIDTVVDRAGTALTGLTWLALAAVAAWSRADQRSLASITTIAVLACWVVIIARARREYVGALRLAVDRAAGAAVAPADVGPAALALPAVPEGYAAFDRRLTREVDTYRAHIAAFHAARAPAAREAAALQLSADLARICRVLEARYPLRDVQAAHEALCSSDPVVRASAVELLDNVLDARLRRQLLPLLETHATLH